MTEQSQYVQKLIEEVSQAIEYYGEDFELECEMELSEKLKREASD